MSPAIIELLVLAGIAIFLIMRLRNVLGTREGFEKPAVQEAPKAERPSFKVIEGERMPISWTMRKKAAHLQKR